MPGIESHPDFAKIKSWAEAIRPDKSFRPKLGIVLGSGFTRVAEIIEPSNLVDFSSLSEFPKPGISGHSGKFITSTSLGLDIVISAGRLHYYEGHSFRDISYPISIMAALGINDVLLTNAAGLINNQWVPGDFMIVKDHINLMGANPLINWPAANPNSRFIDMSKAYNKRLSNLLDLALTKSGAKSHKGTYLAVSGPSYETPAEIKMFKTAGADAVGMSTVPEVILGNYFGLNMCAISCFTNWAAGLNSQELSHSEVLEMGEKSSSTACSVIKEFISVFDKE